MRFTKDIIIGEIPTASNSNYSALFQIDGQVRKRTLGSIITQDIDTYLSGISVAFPTSIFNIADSSITPSQPNLVVSLKNQLAGTVFAAPETLNGTPSFRKLADVDLSETTVAFQDDIPDVSNFVPYTGATANVNLGTRSITSTGGFIGNASTATKLASITTTFTGSYPVTVNVNGVIYSHAGLTYTGSTGTLAANTFIGALSGNATTATTLATARTINGTSFNGSANIVTANWGTSRNITIGNTTKAVNGSANVSWSLAEIGAASQSSLGDYLPLAGGTMTGSINFAASNIGISFNGWKALEGYINNTILSSNVNYIYFRPNGSNSSVGQVYIGVNGQITTTNGNGDSSQWKQAYDWGDYSVYGLGAGVTNNAAIVDDLFNKHDTLFGRYATGSLNLPDGTNGFLFNISRNATYKARLAFTDNKRLFFTSGNNDSQWKEIYHTGNLTTATATVDGLIKLGSNTVNTATAAAVSATASRTYLTQLNSSGQLVVNVPWTNTTYSAGTLALLQAGNNATNRVWSADYLKQGILSLTYNPENLSFGTGLNYNSTTGVLTASQDSIFAYSPQGGLYTTNWNSFALGDKAISIGFGAVANTTNSIVIGSTSFVGGFGSVNVGYSSAIKGSLSSNLGHYNNSNALMSNMVGLGLETSVEGLTVIGRYNKQLKPIDFNTSSLHLQPVFLIGKGRDETDRSNAVTVFADGRADYDRNYSDTYWRPETLVTKKYVDDAVAGNSGNSGYKAIVIDTNGTSLNLLPSSANQYNHITCNFFGTSNVNMSISVSGYTTDGLILEIVAPTAQYEASYMRWYTDPLSIQVGLPLTRGYSKFKYSVLRGAWLKVI